MSLLAPDSHTRPPWDEYFLEIAQVVSKRATCLRRRYGAVIVDQDNVIVSAGYNGSARGEENCCDRGTCTRQELNIRPGERYELCAATGTHSEMNAVMNGDPIRMKGATIYVAGFNVEDGSIANSKPCLMCQRVIKNAKIGRVVYLDENGVKQHFFPGLARVQ